MAFAPIQEGFYASGHPDLTTDFPNPLGLVKVTGNGEYLEPVRFAGKLDFHIKASAHDASSIYLYNEESIPELPAGLLYTMDGGQTWKGVAAYPGIGEPTALSAHPNEASTAALIIGESVFLTSNFGEGFIPIRDVRDPSAITFHLDGKRLLIGNTALHSYDLGTGQITPFPSPLLVEDTISHVAFNHSDAAQIIVATGNHGVFATRNAGIHWVEISSNEAVKDDSVDEEPCDCGSTG